MPGNDDDDRIIRHKIAQAADEVEATGKKPVTLRIWVVVAIALLAFVAGVWVG